ncbi:MAG: synthetase [Bacillales bacterium]|jgi:NAD+ synthase|nr:synthetase [Bacillales bacterium]
MREKIDYLVSWLQQMAKEANAKGLVVGISGGIDSAVVSYLVKRAFPENSLGVIMPCKSIDKDRDDALKVIKGCGIDHLEINLTQSHNLVFTEIKNALLEKNQLNEEAVKINDANTRARLRMTTLYAIAGNYGYLVTGTDNADEWFTGYFTKFGDGGVDLVPLIHLTKSEVRQMAIELGISDSIVKKAPSAGLWEGQTDEYEMGTTYEKIDLYLKGKEIPEKDRIIIERLHQRSEHKRHLAAAPEKEIFL